MLFFLELPSARSLSSAYTTNPICLPMLARSRPCPANVLICPMAALAADTIAMVSAITLLLQSTKNIKTEVDDVMVMFKTLT